MKRFMVVAAGLGLVALGFALGQLVELKPSVVPTYYWGSTVEPKPVSESVKPYYWAPARPCEAEETKH